MILFTGIMRVSEAGSRQDNTKDVELVAGRERERDGRKT